MHFFKLLRAVGVTVAAVYATCAYAMQMPATDKSGRTQASLPCCEASDCTATTPFDAHVVRQTEEAARERKILEKIDRYRTHRGRFSSYESDLIIMYAKARNITFDHMDEDELCDVLFDRTSTFRAFCDGYGHSSIMLQQLDPLITGLIEKKYQVPLHIAITARPDYERRIEGLNLLMLDATKEVAAGLYDEFSNFSSVEMHVALLYTLKRTLEWDIIHPVEERV